MFKYLWPTILTGILAWLATRHVMINLNPLKIQAQLLFSLTLAVGLTAFISSVIFGLAWKRDKLGKTKYERRTKQALRASLTQGSVISIGIVGIVLLRINGVLTPLTFLLIILNLGALLLVTKSRRVDTKQRW